MTAISPPLGPLPYGPLVARLLRPLQRGFLVLNRGFMAPLLHARLGWLIGNPLTGHVMLLRTRGRRSGSVREAPVGYVIRDGCIYCVAGYGERTPWVLNLITDPAVEVILPTRRFKGEAAPVTDPHEWLGAYRALITSFGMLGRAVVGDVRKLDDATLLAEHRSLPVIRITPVEGTAAGAGRVATLAAGPFDPGGRGWIVPYGFSLGVALGLAVRAAARRRSASADLGFA